MIEVNLPDGWALTTLENVATWGSGGTPSRSEPSYYEGDIPWVKTGDLGPRVLYKASEFISELAVQNSSAKFFPKGSVAIAMYGATIGKTSILGIDATTNQACGVGNPIEDITFSEFLYYFLNNEKENFIAKGKGGAQPNISQALIKEHPIPLPPLAEQKVIADKLDTLLAKVDNTRARLERIPEILKSFRQSVLAAAVSGKLIGKIPNRDLDLSECVQILNGARKPVSAEVRKHIQGSFPYYGATGIVDYLNDYTHEGRNLLVGEDGANLLSKAKDLAFIVSGRIWVNNHAHVLKEKDGFSLDFLKISINCLDLSPWVTGTAQPKLTKQSLSKLPVPRFSYDEQTEIVRRVEELFAFADRIEQAAQSAQRRVNNLTQSILAKAFRGELSADWRTANPGLIRGDNSAEALLEKIRIDRTNVKTRKKA